MIFASVGIGVALLLISLTFYFFRRTQQNPRKANESLQTSSLPTRNYNEAPDPHSETDTISEPAELPSPTSDSESIYEESIVQPPLEKTIKLTSPPVPIQLVNTNCFRPPVPPKPKRAEFRQGNNFDFDGFAAPLRSNSPLPPIPLTSDPKSNSEEDCLPGQTLEASVETYEKVSVKKLALNLKFNPLTLLPGSPPNAFRKPSLEKPQSPITISNPSSPTEEYEDNVDLISNDTLLTHVSKNRVKITVPRRPPTRKFKSPENESNKIQESSKSQTREDGDNEEIGVEANILE